MGTRKYRIESHMRKGIWYIKKKTVILEGQEKVISE